MSQSSSSDSDSPATIEKKRKTTATAQPAVAATATTTTTEEAERPLHTFERSFRDEALLFIDQETDNECGGVCIRLKSDVTHAGKLQHWNAIMEKNITRVYQESSSKELRDPVKALVNLKGAPEAKWDGFSIPDNVWVRKVVYYNTSY